ncbi:MAG: hypothetical protein AB7G75_27485, partial [Candidatus Binatia bacterium]
MTFDEVLEQTIVMLQRRGRISYGALKRQFDLDDTYVEDLKVELIEVLEVASDKDGKMLVWVGKGGKGEKDKGIKEETGKGGKGEKEDVPSQWTPTHLAERIRAVTVTDGE